MLAQDIWDFKKALQDQHVLIAYSGYVSEGVLFALGEALKQKLAMDETDRSVTKRVFSVFVEQVQNIIRYSDETDGKPEDEALRTGVITVGIEDGRFFVICGNSIDASKAPELKARLETLAGMDKEELKAFYRQKLRDDPDEGSKGGSIGLIEIARRSSEPIKFDFLSLDDKSTFFCLKAFI